VQSSNPYIPTNLDGHLKHLHREEIDISPCTKFPKLVGSNEYNNNNNSIDFFKPQQVKSTKIVLEETNELLYRFFNTANIAIWQAQNPHLQELISHLIKNKKLIKGGYFLKMEIQESRNFIFLVIHSVCKNGCIYK
jgi:hypothetical protein